MYAYISFFYNFEPGEAKTGTRVFLHRNTLFFKIFFILIAKCTRLYSFGLVTAEFVIF